jgi:hypothetical protein
VSNISTFFFVKQGVAKADITFEKDSYSPNENASILCKIDNSQCKTDVSAIYVKLKRTVRAYDANKQREFKNTVTVVNRRYPGVKAGMNESKLLVLNLKDITTKS